ncbi:hypothetical protein EC957_005198 [Mortierella hygrophila]|uniref:Uncharacterized protein n=1 Tax=Mortierella hygrophila TaxID=979708 RepID=A0A9P6EZK9_9FUNG|nr:hypothetical protein EC957_005198 [Mortierella hygrophila]
MLRSQSSFSQLSSASAALHSPTTTSTTFAGGSCLLDFVSSDDPLGGLSIPRGPPPQIPPQPTDPFLRCFWMMRQLELTMTTGGFLTRKVHVPRQVWYQRATMVRLPAAEAKVSACHTITLMLEQMVAQSKRGMLNLMIGPPTPASSSSSFGPLESVPRSGSSSRAGSRSGSSSSSSSFILPHSPSSPVTPSQASFQSTSTTSTTSTSVSVATAALVPQTLTIPHPPTPTTPSQSAIFTSSTPTSTAPVNPTKSVNRNSGEKSSGTTVLPSYNAIDTEQDRILLTKELEALESTAHHIWCKLSKKLPFVHRPGKYFGPHAVNGATGNSGAMGINATATARQHQHQAQELLSPQEHEYQDDIGKDKEKEGHAATNAVGASNDLKSQWKHFSKSVQKSMANDKVDDTTAYTDSVLSLFQSATILETMYRHYTALSATSSGHAYFASSLQTYYAQIISRLRRIGEFLNLVICAFVVRDLGEFIVKYNKRIGAWIVE